MTKTFTEALAQARRELDKIPGEVEYQGAMRIVRIIEHYAAAEQLDDELFMDTGPGETITSGDTRYFAPQSPKTKG